MTFSASTHTPEGTASSPCRMVSTLAVPVAMDASGASSLVDGGCIVTSFSTSVREAFLTRRMPPKIATINKPNALATRTMVCPDTQREMDGSIELRWSHATNELRTSCRREASTLSVYSPIPGRAQLSNGCGTHIGGEPQEQRFNLEVLVNLRPMNAEVGTFLAPSPAQRPVWKLSYHALARSGSRQNCRRFPCSGRVVHDSPAIRPINILNSSDRCGLRDPAPVGVLSIEAPSVFSVTSVASIGAEWPRWRLWLRREAL
jgi:hypothetical protein